MWEGGVVHTNTASHTAILFVRLFMYAISVGFSTGTWGKKNSSLRCAWPISLIPERSILEISGFGSIARNPCHVHGKLASSQCQHCRLFFSSLRCFQEPSGTVLGWMFPRRVSSMRSKFTPVPPKKLEGGAEVRVLLSILFVKPVNSPHSPDSL